MSRLFAACLACGILAACSVSPTGACTDDSGCIAPAVCDTGRKVCALPCEPKCGIGEVCQSAKCLQQGPVVKSVSAPTTWTKRAGTVTVTASIDSGANATTSSAALHVAGQADIGGTTADTGQLRTYAFVVPGTYQVALSETPVAFTVDAVDNAGHTTLPNAIGSGQLLIDDKLPTKSGVTINGGVTATDTLQWFSQTQAAPIDAMVTLQDGGSGIDTASLKLVSGGTQISTVTSCSSGAQSITCHFSIPAQTAVIPAGQQGEVSFAVVAADLAGNTLAGNTAAFGIDGKPPVITFTIGDAGATGVTTKYPIDGTGCVTVADATFFCGHDGKHFLRAGDTNELAFTLSDSTGVSDKGSGPGPASGTCTIAGSTSTCTVRFDTPTGTFRFPANFATATFTTTTDGTGTVSVTVNATDAVGNPATAVTIPTVAVTRVKWMRQVVPAINLAGAPVLSAQVGQVIVGGSVSAGSDPIQSVKIADGGFAWSAGHLLNPAVTTVTSNMALDPTASTDIAHPTPVLYVNGVDNAYALHINGSNPIDKSCTLNVPGVRGSPVLFGAGAGGEAVVVGPSIAHAYTLNAAGGACTEPHVGLEFGAVALNPGLGPPSANGSTVFMGYDNSGNGTATDIGLKSIQFTGGIFGTTITTGAIGKQPATNTGPDAITPASDLFFEVNGDHKGYRYATDLTTQVWGSTPVLGAAQNIFSQPLVSGSLVFLSSTSLFFHNLGDGTANGTQFPAASVTRVSPPTFGKTATFLSDAANKEVVAFDPTTRTQIWSFKGSGTTAPSTALSSVATEAALGGDGVLYFGDSVGHVFALITDTTPATTAPGDWPRTGFDNCNSNHAGNTGFTCQ